MNAKRGVSIGLIFVLLAVSLPASGCFGSFPLTRILYKFNRDVSGNEIVRWLVFLGLIIVPVYEVGALVDILVLNTIEFWVGEPPPAEGDGDDAEAKLKTVPLDEESSIQMRRTKEGVQTTILRQGEPVRTFDFAVTDESMSVRDSDGRLLAEARDTDGGVEVVSDGTVIAEYDESAVREVMDAYRERGVTAAVAAAAATRAGGALGGSGEAAVKQRKGGGKAAERRRKGGGKAAVRRR